jgi:hypothetical protein
MAKGQPNQAIAQRAYYQRKEKRENKINVGINRPMAYEDINEKVRDKDFNLIVSPHGTLNIDKIDNNQFAPVKGPEGLYINAELQSKKNQEEDIFSNFIEDTNLTAMPQVSSSVSDIAKGMRLALGIPEPVSIPVEKKISRQLTKVTSLNRPVANKTWSVNEIVKRGVYKF